MSRTTPPLLLMMLVLCFGLAPYLAGSRSAGAAGPNFVLLMGDDHGWEETGYNGHPYLKTPVLDRMAARGLRLDRFYAAHPSCSPTRGSVMTGRHPNRYGTFYPGCSIRPEEITVAALLKKAGYATGHFGKWHLGPVKAASPTNPGAMGFDQWISHDNFFEMNPPLSVNGAPPVRFKGEGSQVIVEQALAFIDQAHQAGKPFLAVVWFGSPHEPYSGLPQDLALYDNLPQELSEKMVRLTSNQTGTSVRRPLRDVLRERYAEITAMDRAIGRLRDHLKARGLADNTLLWYCGDNGTPPSGLAFSPLRGRKGMVYEGGVRVPGIIEWPARIRRPRQSNVPAVTSDILPTLCELAGVPLPRRPLDGISLVGLLDGTMTRRSKPICFWCYNPPPQGRRPHQPYIDPELQKGTTPLVKKLGGLFTRNFSNLRFETITEYDYAGPRAILDGRFKLVVDASKDCPVELFDLEQDPAEQHNLADQQPQRVEQLSGQLRQWQQSVLNSLLGRDYPPRKQGR